MTYTELEFPSPLHSRTMIRVDKHGYVWVKFEREETYMRLSVGISESVIHPAVKRKYDELLKDNYQYIPSVFDSSDIPHPSSVF